MASAFLTSVDVSSREEQPLNVTRVDHVVEVDFPFPEYKSSRKAPLSKPKSAPSRKRITTSNYVPKALCLPTERYVIDTQFKFNERETTPLPDDVVLNRVVSAVLAKFQLSRKSKKDKLFGDFFRSNSCRVILEDAFWWTWSFVFAPPPADAYKLDRMLLRMAKEFVATYNDLPREHCDAIMTRFRDGLAQLLFLSFCIAFPMEMGHFGEAFRARLIRLVAIWFVGYEPTRIDSSHWEIENMLSDLTDLERYPPVVRAQIKKTMLERRQKKQKERSARNLKSGSNKKGRNRRLPALLGSGGMSFVRKKKEKTNTAIMKSARTRKQHSMRNSMLVMRYLATSTDAPAPGSLVPATSNADATKRFSHINCAPPRSYDCRVFLTNEVQDTSEQEQEDANAERVLSRAPRTVEQWRKETYSSLVAKYKKRSKQLLKNYKNEVRKESKSMDVCRGECNTETKLLLARKNEILGGDVHEYSNFLVVRHRTRRLQKRMNKKKE